jgi:hypothetical protein
MIQWGRQRRICRLFVGYVFCFAACALGSCQCSSPNDRTADATLDLFATYYAVGVTVEFDGDDNRNGRASLRYSLDSVSWISGPEMAEAEVPDTPQRAWRASLYPLPRGVHVDVEVTIEDADNDGPILLQGSADLPILDIPEPRTTYYVATDGSDGNAGLSRDGAWGTLGHALSAAECATCSATSASATT